MRYALWALRKRQEGKSPFLLGGPCEKYLGGNPMDGYPLGLPAGVAGGLSGK
ncbi:MAG: hypothetical protein K0U90_01660 [Planctomycetes bacterium]|nr:hypothetical protein [Planctomycetota bacterium]MCH9775134.1 hypothetical protein [Planctomycetota bacterium]MCH9790700.1 hypothetical protein [Planctomycetota bacterium]MDF1746601.1 hypothetical protein [Gimesia sp.]